MARNLRKVLGRATLGAILFLPALAPFDYYVNVASQVLIAAIFALGLNLLVGYVGLTSLGHSAYLGGAAYLTAWLVARAGSSHLLASCAAVAGTTLLAAFFGALSLRSTGLGFLMITLALGQILWGLAYRWVRVTGGDNGISGLTRPRPFGLDLSTPRAFYLYVLVAFACVLILLRLFVRSPFGAALRGVRDQPRRMQALGFHVSLIRFCAFVASGFVCAVAGVLYADYHQFVSPHVLALTSSAEVLLMVIAGGAGTLLGPLAGAAVVVVLKNVVSAYVTRWVMLLGFVFVLIVVFLPEGLVPGLRRLASSRGAAAGGGA